MAQDYGIRNESELCNIFFHHLMLAFGQARRSPACVRAEIKLSKKLGYKTRVSASIDFGIMCDPKNEGRYDVLIEVKSWIRPTHIEGGFTPNSSTSQLPFRRWLNLSDFWEYYISRMEQGNMARPSSTTTNTIFPKERHSNQQPMHRRRVTTALRCCLDSGFL